MATGDSDLHWEVTYRSDLRTKAALPIRDDVLTLHRDALRLVLRHPGAEDRAPVDARFLWEGEIIEVGCVVHMPCHLVKVDHRLPDAAATPCTAPCAAPRPLASTGGWGGPPRSEGSGILRAAPTGAFGRHEGPRGASDCQEGPSDASGRHEGPGVSVRGVGETQGEEPYLFTQSRPSRFDLHSCFGHFWGNPRFAPLPSRDSFG